MPSSGIVRMDTRTTELIVSAPLVHVSVSDWQRLDATVSLVEQRLHFANCNDQPATRHFLSDDREKSSFRRQLLAVRRKDTAHDELPVDQRNVRAQKPQLADGGDCRARAVSSREYP